MPRIFTVDEERELSQHIGRFAQAGFPFTLMEIREIAYEYATANDITGFSVTKQIAGEKWARGFLRRHSKELAMRIPKLLSVYRAKCANRNVVNNWFDLYEDLVNKCQITDSNFIWNTDECGCIDIPKARKMVCKTQYKAHLLSYKDKGQTTTVSTFVSASGLVCPPVVIHKGGKVGVGWRNDCPQDVTVAFSDNGWINKRVFYQYGQVFIKFLKDRNLLGPGKKHILLMDSHSTHEFNYKFMKLMIDNGIEVISFPAHTTHCLQVCTYIDTVRL